ncbi:hypothetical protein [Arenibacter algicola]|uniref:hypothetical protein n=1 Tax=Arenibacter algicola TaxID=616991 RepID=UPI0004DF02C7|nr:hypothetical protein [Arenibacter algicola]
MKSKFNVLWIDDQHEDLTGLHKTAVDFNIQLFPFKSMNGGCAALEENPANYDAVLLDAKFFENENDAAGTEDTKWVHKAKDRIRDVDKSLEYFVLTGQAAAHASLEFKNAFQHVFEKGKDEDEDNLFKMLVKSCENRTLTQLKHKYPNPFIICTDEYIGIKHFGRLFSLIQHIEQPKSLTRAEDMLNPMRKIIEALFAKLNQIGIIPDEVSQGAGSINGSSYFLTGKNSSYTYNEVLIHPMVAENIYRLTTLTQDASHNVGSKLEADEYLANSKTNHLYISSIYLLLDILDWMKYYIDANPNKETNLEKWSKKEQKADASIYEGEIGQDENNNYYCGKYHLNYGYVDGNFPIGQKIKILQEDINSNPRTKHFYSHYAVKFEIIN